MRDNPSKQRSFLKIVEVYKCHKAIHAQADVIPASNARHPSPSIELNFAQNKEGLRLAETYTDKSGDT
jgi:hypothetical protein